jgi:hypothetical protein
LQKANAEELKRLSSLAAMRGYESERFVYVRFVGRMNRRELKSRDASAFRFVESSASEEQLRIEG